MVISDDYILSLRRVTPQIAAKYLGLSVEKIREGIQDGSFPFGTVVGSREAGKLTYDIRPQALVDYGHRGAAKGSVELSDESCKKIAALVVEQMRAVQG